MEIEKEKPVYSLDILYQDEDVVMLMNNITRALQMNKLQPRTFFFKYINDSMKHLLQNDIRGHRWSDTVLIFSQELLSTCGYNVYDNVIRGALASYFPTTKRCNLILPSSSTLDKYFHHKNEGCGDTEQDNEEFKLLIQTCKPKIKSSISILQFDAMDLNQQLSVNQKTGQVSGFVKFL